MLQISVLDLTYERCDSVIVFHVPCCGKGCLCGLWQWALFGSDESGTQNHDGWGNNISAVGTFFLVTGNDMYSMYCDLYENRDAEKKGTSRNRPIGTVSVSEFFAAQFLLIRAEGEGLRARRLDTHELCLCRVAGLLGWLEGDKDGRDRRFVGLQCFLP